MQNQKVILVTGCSSGFGLLTAVRLAAGGHLVWASMRDLSKRTRLEEQLTRRGVQAVIRELDVTKPSVIKNVIDEILKTHGRIDVLVNNAGYSMTGFFEDLSEEEIRAQMETNFFGVQHLCRQVVPLMRQRGAGKIINISSIAGQVATPGLGAYNASKWALEGFSESLYFELRPFGVSVVLIEPGLYPTDLFTKNVLYAKGVDNPQSPYFRYSQRLKQILQMSLKKIGRDPDEIAKLIERIINDPNPRLRYISDFSSWARVMAQQVLPKNWVAYIIGRVINANK
ncbi:MAG: SDR family NAD(P)-dependent oxidoreductase [Candidatus Omnitrophica bacterium]|nr:SDR family NAD(P)-dependent oxidoreductase [Candidatus Omnitrophota bacterium]